MKAHLLLAEKLLQFFYYVSRDAEKTERICDSNEE